MRFHGNIHAIAQGVEAHIVAEILCISLISIVMADSSSSSVKKDACTIFPPLSVTVSKLYAWLFNLGFQAKKPQKRSAY